jgi:hypothetical protein
MWRRRRQRQQPVSTHTLLLTTVHGLLSFSMVTVLAAVSCWVYLAHLSGAYSRRWRRRLQSATSTPRRQQSLQGIAIANIGYFRDSCHTNVCKLHVRTFELPLGPQARKQGDIEIRNMAYLTGTAAGRGGHPSCWSALQMLTPAQRYMRLALRGTKLSTSHHPRAAAMTCLEDATPCGVQS